MNLQARTSWTSSRGEDVALLQRELAQLGHQIAPAETGPQTFGQTTASAIVTFQRAHALELTGIVDERTATAINAGVDAVAPSRDVATGRARLQVSVPVADILVGASDRDLRTEEPLGEATTDAGGEYHIAYSPGQLRRAEKGTADFVVQAFSPPGVKIVASEVLFNPPVTATLNLAFLPRGTSRLSEYELLLATLAPVMETLAPADVTRDDTAFRSAVAGIDWARFETLPQYAQLSRSSEVPTDAKLAKAVAE